MSQSRITILHYSASPAVGGVEAVIDAHVRAFLQAGYQVSVVAGRGEAEALPPETEFISIPLVDSDHPQILEASALLEQGDVPEIWEDLVKSLEEQLTPLFSSSDHVIVHNIFTKHFNLPLTAALFHLINTGIIRNCIAWCHDFTWTSPNSRNKVFPGQPWDLLRTFYDKMTYVVVSAQRQQELAALLGCPLERIHVVYNGVEPAELLGLTPIGWDLIKRLDLWEADLILLMPVRVTQAKHVEYALQVTAALKARELRPKLILTGPPDPHDSESMTYFRSLQELRAQLGVEEEMRFVFESGPTPDEPFPVPLSVVADLYRLADVMFMPSHREGFGMPVLEAGLAGLPVVASDVVPAAKEIGGEHVLLFSPDQPPERLAAEMLAWLETLPTFQLRRKVRQRYTWEAIFKRDIEPLLQNEDTACENPSLWRQIDTAPRLWLFLDYDGTLADFAPTPDHIQPDAALIELITQLVQLPDLRVSIISGRRLSHIQQLLPVDDLMIAGTYGVELSTWQGEAIKRVDLAAIRPLLASVKQAWQVLLAGQEGFYLEDKDWALAIHAKDAQPAAAEYVLRQGQRLAAAEVRSQTEGVFRILGGSQFLEIGPALAHKGRTLDYLFSAYPDPTAMPIYIGDDDKDEEAFAVVQAHGGLALVVNAMDRPTLADCHLDSPAATRKWLSKLLEHRRVSGYAGNPANSSKIGSNAT